jgi:hypothetical protein
MQYILDMVLDRAVASGLRAVAEPSGQPMFMSNIYVGPE